jgi:ferric hydroxamate transport system substrate-binding protein
MYRCPNRARAVLAGLVALAAATVATTAAAAPTHAAGATASTSITLQDDTGSTVVIPHTAKRIVALEWTFAEDALALKATVVGVTDIKGYKSWLKTPPIPSDVADVGTRAQPSLEAIAALRPDLILTATIRVGDTLPQLSSIAPTLVFDPYPKATTQYAEMESAFTTIAKATGTQKRAALLLKQVHGTFAKAKAILTKKGVTKHPISTTQAFTSGGQSIARLFTPDAMVTQILEKMGLQPAWKGDSGAFGFTSVGLEGLAKLPDDAYLLFVAQASDNPFAGSWQNNSAYQALPIVKAGHVLSLRPDTWFFGGPISAGQLARQVLARLAP